MFRIFIIKERRPNLKRNSALFTCLVSRAVHIEEYKQGLGMEKRYFHHGSEGVLGQTWYSMINKIK